MPSSACCRCPVASLSYVPQAASGAFPCGGLIAGSLEGACFWEQVSDSSYRPHQLPLEAAGCIDIQVEAQSRHCLVTYRPGRPRLQGSLRLRVSASPRLHVRSACCRALQPVAALRPDGPDPDAPAGLGPAAQLLLLARPDLCSRLVLQAAHQERRLQEPHRRRDAGVCRRRGLQLHHGRSCACASTPSLTSDLWAHILHLVLQVWDASSGSLLQKLPADLPVLDISPFSVNGEHFLASLTEKMLKVYRWD